MTPRISYKVDGEKVPSLNNILDNCKIGGIGNLLYRAHQAGLAGRELRDKTGDTTNAGWLAVQEIKAYLNDDSFDSSEYSYSCFDRAQQCVFDFISWRDDNNIKRTTRSLTLVSAKLKYGDTFDVYESNNGHCLINVYMQNNVYPENLIRLAADVILLLENMIDISEAHIININNPKTLDEKIKFTVHTYHDFLYAADVFKKMRELHDMQDTLKTLI